MATDQTKQNSEGADIREIKEDLGNKMSLQVVHDSEGGKLLVDSLVADILGAVDSIAMQASTLTLQEFVALGCKIKERLDILRALTGAKAAREILDELLAEKLKEEEENAPGGAQ